MPMLQKQILCPTKAEERGVGGGEDERWEKVCVEK